MENSWILSVILFWPLLVAIFVLLVNDERLIKQGSIVASLIPLALSTLLWIGYDTHQGGIQAQVQLPWIPDLGASYHLGVDGLSVPLIFLTALLTTLSLYYSARTITERVKQFFFLFNFLAVGMYGVFMALDYILFYVFWEIGLVPMYFLIGIWGYSRREYAAIKFFLYTLVGSVLMLLAILGVYFSTGTFNILEAAALRPFSPMDEGNNFLLQSLAFIGFFIAFAIKVPMWPFHTWLPDAHTEAPTAGSVILAGILLKLGAYGLIRICLPTFPEAFQHWGMWVVVLGVISIIYGAFVCMAQWDLKRLIAYSSVSHMGYIMLGIGAAAVAIGSNDAGTFDSQAMAINGAALQMFNHGIITGALFFLVGIIYERAHTRDLKQFGGLSKKLPYFYGTTMFAAFASLGLPGLAGFWGELFVFRGAFDIVAVYAAVGVIGIVVTAAYILWKIVQNMFLGEFDEERWGGLTDMSTFEKVTLWPLVAGMIFLGIYPTPLLSYFNLASVEILRGL